MAPSLDHTIVPVHDKVESAKLIARIMGMEYEEPFGHFQPVKAANGLSLDFDNRENFDRHHYAFLVSDDEFDGIFGRVTAEGIKYGSAPDRQDDMEINHRHHGRGFYFRDVNGHSWEVITHTYVRE